MADDAGTMAEQYRSAWPGLLGRLVRDFGRVELAEDCLQEACTRALGRAIDDPVAWIATVARRLVIDELRHVTAGERLAPRLVAEQIRPTESVAPSMTGDDRLDLLVLACHPILPRDSRMPLALRFVLGTSTADIADAFATSHRAMSARLTRAKRRLDLYDRRFAPLRPDQRTDVLDVIGVLYTLGHTAVSGDSLGRSSDRDTAIGLARSAVATWPDEPEAAGLLALLLLTEARHHGRIAPDGALTTLRTADRRQWRRELIDEGLALSTTVLPTRGRYALQSGIAGLHAVAPTWEQTDWAAITSLYDRLVERWPAPSAQMARAIAEAHGPDGPGAGLAVLDELDRTSELPGSAARQLAAARAELLRLAGRTHEARAGVPGRPISGRKHHGPGFPDPANGRPRTLSADRAAHAASGV